MQISYSKGGTRTLHIDKGNPIQIDIVYRDTADGENKKLRHQVEKIELDLNMKNLVANSISFNIANKSFNDNQGLLQADIKRDTGVGVDVGRVDYENGVATLDNWQNGENRVLVHGAVAQDRPPNVNQIAFRTPISPLKTSGFQLFLTVVCVDYGTSGRFEILGVIEKKIVLNVNPQGNISHEITDIRSKPTETPTITGKVDFRNGVITLQSQHCSMIADSIKYNAVGFTFMPLDSEIIGLDPVRLPTDGRVPFVRRGDLVAITELKQKSLDDVEGVVDLGVERLSDVSIFDSSGVEVVGFDVDLDKGNVRFSDEFIKSNYQFPLIVKYRIMDMSMVNSVDISGRVGLAKQVSHDFSTNAVVSSMLLVGDLQARATNVFSQKTWTKVFSHSLIDERAESQLQVANNPILVTNESAISERWALVFTNPTTVKIIGETLGEIAQATITSDITPINPQTKKPYFRISSQAFGSGWSAGNVIRFDTVASSYPFWVGNAIQQHNGTSQDVYDFSVAFHANIDRKRGE